MKENNIPSPSTSAREKQHLIRMKNKQIKTNNVRKQSKNSEIEKQQKATEYITRKN